MIMETEAKFAGEDVRALRARLAGQGAVLLGRRFEVNLILDTPGRELRARDELLRLRRAIGRESEATLTLKRVAGAAGAAQPGVKVRQEIETGLDDAAKTQEIFAALGYTAAFTYEKLRETWRLAEALVCLDTVPFGEFVEIEGEGQAIRQAASLLGLDMARACAKSYHELNREHRLRLGLSPQEGFVFEPDERERLEGLAKTFGEGGGG